MGLNLIYLSLRCIIFGMFIYLSWISSIKFLLTNKKIIKGKENKNKIIIEKNVITLILTFLNI